MDEVESGSWLCFSRKVASQTAIEYSESGYVVSNYYVQRARWAHSALELRKSANSGGEVVLWIASEYFEQELKDLYPLENVANLPEDMCLVRVDDNFHYGQNFSKADRFLVYHPPGRQRMVQGRFRPNLFAAAFAGLDNILPDIQASGFSLNLKKDMFKKLVGAGSTAIGHSLHRFRKPHVIQFKKPSFPLFSLEYITAAEFAPENANTENAIVRQTSIIKLSEDEKVELADESVIDAEQVQRVIDELLESESIQVNQVPVFKPSDKSEF